jgi:WD40 repeat protein
MRIVKLKGMRQVNGLHYAPDGRRLLAVGGYEVRSIDEARWVDVVGGTETLRVPLNASCYAVSPDLSRMAVGNSHTTGSHIPIPPVVTFDPTDPTWHEDDSRWWEGAIHYAAPESEFEVDALAFDVTGERLATAFSTTRIGMSRTTARHFHQDAFVVAPHATVTAVDHRISGIAYSPVGTAFATVGGSADSTITVWGASSQHPEPTFGLPTSPRCRLVFSPDGKILAAANWKFVFPLTADLQGLHAPLAHPKQVNTVAFTPDGHRVLTTCTDKLVRVWDATTGQLVTSYDWNVGVTNAIAVAPDGLTAAVSGQSGRVVLFDLDA